MPATSTTGDLLVDTHALLWWQAGSDRLSRRAQARLGSARRILVSPISCWEVAMLVRKGRVRLDRPTIRWTRDLLAQERVAAAELSAATAVAAAELADFHGDPADRLLYATARSMQVELLTKDRRLADYAAAMADVVVVW